MIKKIKEDDLNVRQTFELRGTTGFDFGYDKSPIGDEDWMTKTDTGKSLGGLDFEDGLDFTEEINNKNKSFQNQVKDIFCLRVVLGESGHTKIPKHTKLQLVYKIYINLHFLFAVSLWFTFMTSITTFLIITWFLIFYLRSHSGFSNFNTKLNLDKQINEKLKNFMSDYITKKGIEGKCGVYVQEKDQKMADKLDYFSKV